MMIDKVVKLFAPAAKDAKQALAPLLEQAKRGLEPVKGKAASAIESLSQHPFSRKVTTEFDNAIARATVIYAEVSGFTAVQQQRAVVQATEVELSDARQAFSEAESVLKSKRQSYEEAQLVATEEISAFNLNPDLPVHVKEYYFRSTMEELQKSQEREAVSAAQTQLDSCTVDLQVHTKACGDAFSRLGEVESSWSHARTVIMSWATVLSLIGSFLGLLLSFQVTKIRIETSVSRTRDEFIDLLNKRDEKNDATARIASLEATLAAAAIRLNLATSQLEAASGATATPTLALAKAESELNVNSDGNSNDYESSNISSNISSNGSSTGNSNGNSNGTSSKVKGNNDTADREGRSAAATIVATNTASESPVETIDVIAKRIDALSLAAEKLEKSFSGLQAALPTQSSHPPSSSSSSSLYGAAIGWSAVPRSNLGIGESLLVATLVGALVVRILDTAVNR